MTAAAATVQAGWFDLLQRYHWQWFCTFTFRYRVHPERADKLYRVWVSQLNRTLFGARWHKRPASTVFWVRALEWQKRGVLHYHALVGSHMKDLNDYAMRRVWSDIWNEHAGFARVEAIRSTSDVNGYVTKYCTKGGELDLSPNIKAVTPLSRGSDPYALEADGRVETV